MTIFLITGASGVGKTTLSHEMQERELWQECISHTTRPMRKEQGEKDGVTYYFISEEIFQNKLENGEFAEHVSYDGNRYAISHKEIERVTGNGKNVFVIVEHDGFKQMKEAYPEAVSIFLYMSKEDCLMNMLARGDKAEKAIKRIQLYDDEMKSRSEYDYVIKNINGKQEEVISVLSSIVIQYS